MVHLNLLYQAIASRLRVSVDGDRLVVRGPRDLEALALELLAHKAKVIAILKERPELAKLDRFTAEVLYLFDGELFAKAEGPAWDSAIPLDGGLEDLHPSMRQGRRK